MREAAASDERVGVLRAAYDAFNRRDVDTALALLDPLVEWPNVLGGTTERGVDAVRAYWNQQFEQIDPHVEALDIIPAGEAIVVAVHQIVRDRQGRVLSDKRLAHAYRFRNGKILAMRVHPTVADALS